MTLDMITTVKYPNGLVLNKVRLKGSRCCFLSFMMKLLEKQNNKLRLSKYSPSATNWRKTLRELTNQNLSNSDPKKSNGRNRSQPQSATNRPITGRHVTLPPSTPSNNKHFISYEHRNWIFLNGLLAVFSSFQEERKPAKIAWSFGFQKVNCRIKVVLLFKCMF